MRCVCASSCWWCAALTSAQPSVEVSTFELLKESATQAYMLLPFFPQVQELRREAQPCVSFLAVEFRRVYRAVLGGAFESCGGASCHVHMHMLVLHAM